MPRQNETTENVTTEERNRNRFLEKVKKDPDTGCWIWQSSLNTNGYGQFRLKGKIRKAHRAAWLIFRGPIPKGMTLDHKCRNIKCVNPKHLELVSVSENVRREKSDQEKEKFIEDKLKNA
jgi:hypothetical protein